MTSLSRLGPLSHFDLNLLGAHQIFARHTESSACHLLDGRTAAAFSKSLFQTVRILSAFAGVGLPMEPVHGDSQRLVGLFGNGTIGHGSRLEPCHDRVHALHFFQRYRFFPIAKVHKTPEIFDRILLVDKSRILFEQFVVSQPCRLL